MAHVSDIEYAQFVSDNKDLIYSLLPEQSKVVAWNGLSILVYIGINQVQVGNNLYPDVYLSDVTTAPQIAAISTIGYGTTPSQSMLDTLPQATIDTIKDDAALAGDLLNQAGQALTQAAGAAAEAARQGLQDVLTPVLIGAVILFGLLYLPKGR
jgi:hypothetical protein